MASMIIQDGYGDSREANAIRQSGHPIELSPTILIGSVEWVESFIGHRKPDFYPEWTKSAWHRKIYKFDYPVFHKSADSYKCREALVESLVVSEIVEFTDEWRYYVANGEVLCSWWYSGNHDDCDKEPNGPPLPFDIPSDFCGAIDMGRLETGELALVEVQHPYAIGWYGEMSESHLYYKFLREGRKYLDTY